MTAARGKVDLHLDHDLIHKALYEGYPEPFCVARGRLIRAILQQRSTGMLSNDTFEGILINISNPAMRSRVFSFFQVQLPEDMKCA